MEIAEHIADLFAPLDHAFLRLRTPALQDTLEALSLNIIHDDQEAVLRVDHVDNARQVRVAQAFEHIRLDHESLLHGLEIAHAVLPNLLDRPRFIGALIDCKINHAHTAAAYLAQDLILMIYQ